MEILNENQPKTICNSDFRKWFYSKNFVVLWFLRYTIIVDCLIIADFIALMTMAITPKYYSKFVIISFVLYEVTLPKQIAIHQILLCFKLFLYSTRVSLWYSMNCDYKFGRNLEIAAKQIDCDAVRLNK